MRNIGEFISLLSAIVLIVAGSIFSLVWMIASLIFVVACCVVLLPVGAVFLLGQLITK